MSLAWLPPIQSEQNGIITQYIVELTNSWANTSQHISHSSSIEISALIPFKTYFFVVGASTRIGVGPFGNSLFFTTLEEGNIFCA